MRIEVMKIFKESFKNLIENKIEWMKIAMAPVLVSLFGFLFMMVTYLPSGLSILDVEAHKNLMNLPVIAIIGNLVGFICSIIATVSIKINAYRYAAFKEGGDKWWTLNLNWRFIKTILYGFLITILCFIYVVFSTFSTVFSSMVLSGNNRIVLAAIIGAILVFFGLYCFLRIGLTYFLIAIDRVKPLQASWSILKGNVFRYFGLIFLILISAMLLLVIVMSILAALGWLFSSVAVVLTAFTVFSMYILPSIVTYITFAIISKADSLVYKTITEGKAPEKEMESI